MELSKDITQFAKSDSGKLPIHMVPMEIVKNIAAIRQYGFEKYNAPNNWVLVEKTRYVDAMLRHIISYLEGEINDPESGLPHLWHAACNMSFICEMEKSDWEEYKSRLMKEDSLLQEQIKSYVVKAKSSISDYDKAVNLQ